MANTLATPTWILNETGQRFVNSVKGVAAFNRSLDDSFRQAGAKVGDTVNYRLPQQFIAKRGQAYEAQDLYDQTVPVRLSYQSHVDFDYSIIEETLELDRIRERYINPAADTLASDADQQGMKDVYPSVYQAVGTPGTVPSTNLVYLDAVTKILDSAGPDDNLRAVLAPNHRANLVNANLTLFNPANVISEGFKRGKFSGEALGISEWYVDQNVPTHTTGTFTSCTPLVNGASQTGSTLACDGWASGATTLKKGDVFTIAGVYKVNPISKVSTGELMQFTVTADTSDSAGAMAALPISPSIVTSGQLQNVDASPANNAAINVWGSSGTYALATTPSRQSLVFGPDAFGFVMADLAQPVGGADFQRIRSRDFGISMSWIRQFDINTYKNKSRIDILHAGVSLQPRLACRVAG